MNMKLCKFHLTPNFRKLWPNCMVVESNVNLYDQFYGEISDQINRIRINIQTHICNHMNRIT